MESRKAQITLFVVLAVIIVAAVGLVFYLKVSAPVPAKIKNVEDYFLGCVEEIADEGLKVMAEHGGRIKVYPSETISAYAPFQSHLNFFGLTIPYWFYVSGRNIYQTYVPTLKGMEDELADYITGNLERCSFESFSEQGYAVALEKGAVKVKISEHDVLIEVNSPLTVEFEDITKRIVKHNIRKRSEFGSLYNLARQIFSSEQKNLFLEDYTLDAITLNAPTTDNILSCSPIVWNTAEVISGIKTALQDNLRTVKLKGSYYHAEDKYFTYDIGKNVGEQVIFFYSPSFPTHVEISPEDGGIMKAAPVGLQEGLGALGFCYVPYHFVYSVTYPVLVQLFDKKHNLFQFPMVVIIDKNQPRNAEVIEEPGQIEAELCKHKTAELTVYTYNPDLRPVEAEIRFKCVNTVCEIGDTELNGNEAGLTAKFPPCVNGLLIASADGYVSAKQLISTNEAQMIELLMKPYHLLDIELEGREDETILLNFKSDEGIASVVYPFQKTIRLAEGFYHVDAYLFKKGNIKLAGETTETCVNIPVSGIGSIFGLKREECHEITIPEQVIEEVITGGGKTELNLNEIDLSTSAKIVISVPRFKVPGNVNEMQENYNLAEESELSITLK